MNLTTKTKQRSTFDAIVVGSGISGGWAAKELTEKGLKVLLLERGRDVKHGEYPTMHKKPWELPNGDELSAEEKKDYQIQLRTGYTVKESTKHWWVKDTEEPYTEIQRFDWMRGYHVGGRSLLWGRQSYRWSEMDFESNLRDGHGVDWPIRYQDLAPWYSYVEKYIGVSGRKEGLKQLPDSEFLPEMQMNCVEEHVRDVISQKFENRLMTIGRTANVTQAVKGRGPCQYRNLCIRGCPFGAYFSSNSSTLPAAYATGNLTLRPFSIVKEVVFDQETQKATGVKVIDSESLEEMEFFGRIVFLNASTVGTTSIMLNSISDRFPNGFGNDSDQLGRNMMDHHLSVGAYGDYEGYREFEDKYYYGRRPNGIYIPRFRNLEKQETDYVRGFGYQGGASRQNWQRNVPEMMIGKELKDELTKPGKWVMGLGGFGEFLPYSENRMTMNKNLLSKWGLPTVTFDVGFKENELKMRKDMAESAREMLEVAGAQNVQTFDNETGPGLGIHEMGTARMGRDPKTSVLNGFNQVHAAKNVFVTDGSCMTSSACQNPSLTYMALTARAADYAVSELNKRNL